MLADDLFFGTKKYQKKFMALCDPIKQYLGITTAGYIRIDQNGGMQHIFSNIKWMERAIEKNYVQQDPGIVHPNNMNSGFTFVVGHDDQEYKDSMLKEAIHEFNFHHAFCYVEKNHSDFTLFFFATDKDNTGIVNKIVNAPDLVKKLIGSLTKQIQLTFTDLPDHTIDSLQLKGDLFLKQKGIVFHEPQETHRKIQLLQKSGILSTQLEDLERVKLSKQEINCLRIYRDDHNLKNIAKNLNIAVTTATTYIENIKQKLNCPNKQKLLTIADVLTGLGKI